MNYIRVTPQVPGLAAGMVTDHYQPEVGAQLLCINPETEIDPTNLATVAGLILSSGNPESLVLACHMLHIPCVTTEQDILLLIGQNLTLDADQGYLWLNQPLEIHTTSPQLPNTKTNLYGLSLDDNDPSYADGFGPISRQYLLQHTQTHNVEDHTDFLNARLADFLITAIGNNQDKPFLYQYSSISLQKDQPLPWISETLYPQHLSDSQILKIARTKCTNIHPVFPDIRSLDQWKLLKKQLYFQGLKRTANCNFYLELTHPSTIWQLDALVRDGLDGIVINLAQLATAMVGLPLNQGAPSSGIDLNHPVIQDVIQTCVATAAKHQIESIVLAPHLGFDRDMTQKIVKWGATSLSIATGLIPVTREHIARNELNLSKNRHRITKKKKQ